LCNRSSLARSSFWSDVHLLESHAFPTRRSSDLSRPSGRRRCGPREGGHGLKDWFSKEGRRSGLWSKLGVFDSWLDSSLADTWHGDRKSTRLNSSHVKISYAVFCLKKKTRDGSAS